MEVDIMEYLLYVMLGVLGVTLAIFLFKLGILSLKIAIIEQLEQDLDDLKTTNVTKDKSKIKEK